MAQETNHAAIVGYIVLVLLVLGLLAGYMMISGVNSNVAKAQASADAAKASADSATTSVNNAVASIPAAIASVVPATSTTKPSQVVSYGSSGSIGVNGNWIVQTRHCDNTINPSSTTPCASAYESYVLSRLKDNNNRILFNAIANGASIENQADITHVVLGQYGTVTTNIDPARGAVSSREVYVPMTVEVTYYADGNHGDSYTKLFEVNAQISDLNCGTYEIPQFCSYNQATYDISSIGRVSQDYVLP